MESIDQQQLEQAIFLKASSLSRCYQGGDWRYVGCGQNTVFMAPNSKDAFDVTGANGVRLILSSEAFGVLATLQAMKALQVDSKYLFLRCRFEKIKDFVRQHAEAENILSCLNISDGQDE